MFGIDAGNPQHPDGHVVALPQKTCQQVLGTDIIIAAPYGVLHGNLHHPAGSGSQPLGRVAAGQPHAHALFDDLHQHIVGESSLGQHRVGKAVALPHQAQQQVLGSHISVAQLPGRFLAQPQGLLRSGTEFILIHVSLPSFPPGVLLAALLFFVVRL